MFWSTSFLTALVLHGAAAIPAPRPNHEIKTADKVLTLRRMGVKGDSSKALLTELAATATTPLISVENGGGYAVDVELGGDSFTVIFDTGSSDLWVATQNVECVNPKGKHVPTKKCAFGPLWSGNFEEGKVKGENFNISYGDGEFLVGTLGYEDVSVAGITVKNQEIAAVTKGYWAGDGVTSGIIGFAYSSLTSAYTGTNPAKDNPQTNNVHYNNWFANAVSEGLVDPIFSVAIERGANGGGGQVALGGLPTISFNHNFATTPLDIHSFTPRHPQESKNYTYYTIQPEGLVLDGESASSNFYAIVDTGTTLAYLPTKYAEAINAAFDPPAVYVQSEGLFEADCKSTPPSFAITIGGTNFKISAAELLLSKAAGGYDPNTGLCVTGVQAAPQPPAILGDTFLKNVVAVFDVGNSEMRFAPHVSY